MGEASIFSQGLIITYYTFSMLKEGKLRLRCHKLHIKEKNIDGIWFVTCYDQDHDLDCQAYIHEILKSFKNQAKQINGHADINLILTLYVIIKEGNRRGRLGIWRNTPFVESCFFNEKRP